MKILLSNCEGYQLSESAKVVYSPGYDHPDLNRSEHECLCQLSKLIENILIAEGHTVLARRYDETKYATFLFDKSRESKGCDLAISLALNNSQNSNAQFSSCLISMVQDDNIRSLFDGMLCSLGRYVPIQSRFPNSLRRIPFLEGCKRSGTPAILVLPFFITDRKLTNEKLGEYIQASAKAISEAILAYRPKPSSEVHNGNY